VAVLKAHGDGENAAHTKLARCLRWHGSNQATVGQAARADFDGFEQAGESATRADGVNQIALRKDDRLASGEVGGDDGHGDVQVFEPAGFKDALDKVAEAVIAGEAQARRQRAMSRKRRVRQVAMMRARGAPLA